MNSDTPDDLLSAFYDRELSAAEQAAAQSRLQSSPQAKQELDDYQRLSEMLRALPRHSAPTEFAAAAMQRAEREMLIPTAPAAIVDHNDLVFRRIRRWQKIAAGSAALAAAAGFLVWIGPSRPNANAPVIFKGDLVAAKRVPKTTLGVRRESIMAAGRNGGTDVRSGGVLDGNAGEGVIRSVPLALSATAQRAPQSAASSAPIPGLAANSKQIVFPANLKTAQAGEVVEALENSGDQVAIVRLTVVDRAETLDGIQSVLVRNTRQTVQNLDDFKSRLAEMKRKGGVAIPAPADRKSDEVICVYVEGTRDQLVGVFEDLQRESRIQEAQLTNTITVAQLENFADEAASSERAKGLASKEAVGLFKPQLRQQDNLGSFFPSQRTFGETTSPAAPAASSVKAKDAAVASKSLSKKVTASEARTDRKEAVLFHAKPGDVRAGLARRASNLAQQKTQQIAVQFPAAVVGKIFRDGPSGQAIAATALKQSPKPGRAFRNAPSQARFCQVFFVLDDKYVARSATQPSASHRTAPTHVPAKKPAG